MGTAASAREWLDAHINLETGVGAPVGRDRRAQAPTLDRIRQLVALLGSPQLEYPTIHVTGTNGKGSTVRAGLALLDELGFGTGGYTSPHLEAVNERILLRGETIEDRTLDELLDVVRLVEPALDEAPSYFEILTAAALRAFADEAVDVAVVEVGLGGTWDATNVVEGAVAVVTNVAVDHVEYLGTTTTEIAREKAGIVRPGATLVLGETDPDLEPLFRARGPGRLWRRDVDFGVRDDRNAVGGRLVELYTPGAHYPDVFLPVHGAHQAANASLALAAVEAFLGAPVPREVVDAAFGGLVLPGRLEVVGRHPLVILDGAHNVAAAEALRSALAEEFPPVPRTLVVGTTVEKDPVDMLTALGVDAAARVVCCRVPSPRAADPEDLARAAESVGVDPASIDVAETVREAIGLATLVTPAEGEIVITGSLFLVGAARTILR